MVIILRIKKTSRNLPWLSIIFCICVWVFSVVTQYVVEMMIVTRAGPRATAALSIWKAGEGGQLYIGPTCHLLLYF